MSRKIRISVLIALACALGSCSFQYEIRAVAIDGELVFIPEKSDDHCLRSINVSQEGNGRVVWSISYPSEPEVGEKCPSIFPLRFGTVPEGMIETTASAELEGGIRYSVSGYDSFNDYYVGEFEIDHGLIVKNLPH